MRTCTLKIDFETFSHELRTPLVGILGMTELMEDEALSPAQKEQIAIIHQAGDRLLLFINKILTSSKVKAHIRN